MGGLGYVFAMGDFLLNGKEAGDEKVTLVWDGRNWVPKPPVPLPPEEARARLESAVNDAVAGGFTVDSKDGDSYVISRPADNPWLTGTGVVGVSISVLLTLFRSLLLGLALLTAVVYFWWKDAHRRTRIAVYSTPTGQVVQEEIYAIRRKLIPTKREIEDLRAEADALDNAADEAGEAPWMPPEARTATVAGAEAPAVTGPLVQEPVGSMVREWWQKYLDHRRNV